MGIFKDGDAMPRVTQKTHKGLAKRVKVTANRKVKRHGLGGGHLMSVKSGNRRRKVNRKVILNDIDARKVLTALLA
ncbi:MAG: 50S ribosomal protein L35 [Phycisphaerae bacterium]|nr:50S ribosomal protein L35 [Phycisphaerae bacterium]